MSRNRRQTHTSYDAYLQSMQMSRANIFIFIEGGTDRYFYDKICNSILGSRGIQYQICLAQELPGNRGGKPGLLNFFDYLNQSAKLFDEFNGKQTAAIFFLDKDIDDILGESITSEHIVYTEYYDVESYSFINGNLVEASSAAASLDLTSVRTGLDLNNDSWRQNAAERWKEWVKFCVFTRIRNINCEYNYGVSSRININMYGPLDDGLHSAQLLELERRSGLTPIGFKRIFGRITRIIDSLYQENNHDLVFKGKWYTGFLVEDVRRIAGARPLNLNGLIERLNCCLQLSLNFEQAWANHFKQPLEDIINRLS